MAEYPRQPRRLGEDVRGGRWLEVAAVATWLLCGLPALASIATGGAEWWPAAVFVAAFAVYGAALLALFYLPEGRRRIVPVMLLLIESVAGMTMVYVSGHYLGGTGATSATIVIVAAQAPYILNAATVWILVAIQTVVMSLLFFREAPFTELLSLAMAIGGFQVFACASSFLALHEAAARATLAGTNAELQATRVLLAERSRAEERLRISRDLHDALGHHLTALSLQLDVASRISEGKAADHVRQAHAITRLLLSDVRDVVSALRETNVDLARAIRTIAESPSGIAIHLDVPPVLDVHDTERAHALLRCVQEVITNATRHARARNLWIRIDARPDGIALHAHDDGHGAPQLSLGHGLIGMRERFAALAGSIEFESLPDRGFEVRGFLPTPQPVA